MRTERRIFARGGNLPKDILQQSSKLTTSSVAGTMFHIVTLDFGSQLPELRPELIQVEQFPHIEYLQA